MFDEQGYIRWVLPYIRDEQTVKEAQLIEKLFGLPGGCNILDLCCGNGRHGILLSKHSYKISGVDISHKLISIGRKGQSKHNGHLQFCLSDMRNIPFGSNEFDGVFNFYSSFGFYSYDEDVNVLEEVSRVLKPQCKFLLEVFDKEELLQALPFSYQIQDEDRGLEIKDKWEFNPKTNILAVNRLVFNKKNLCGTAILKIRLYGISEITDMFFQASLKPLGVYRNPHCSYPTGVQRIIAIGEKVER